MSEQMAASNQEILSFSQDLAEMLYAVSQFYPPMFAAAVQLAQAPPSPSVESDLMDIRQGATDMADSVAIYTRSITLLEAELQSNPVPAIHDPRIIRPLLLDLLESAILLAHVPSQADLFDLSVISPDELQARLDNPQIAAWLDQNLTVQAKLEYSIEALQEETAVSPEYSPTFEQPQSPVQTHTPTTAPVQPLPESPYPQVESAPESPQQIPQAPPAPVQPQAPSQPEPWTQPIGQPERDDERSRHRPI